MKEHSARIMPTMNLDTAANTLNIQQDIKAAELEEIIGHDYLKTNKLWSNYPTSSYTTSFAEGLIHMIVKRTPLYSVKRVGLQAFQVHYLGPWRKRVLSR